METIYFTLTYIINFHSRNAEGKELLDNTEVFSDKEFSGEYDQYSELYEIICQKLEDYDTGIYYLYVTGKIEISERSFFETVDTCMEEYDIENIVVTLLTDY